jgi:endonuclease YncB( thermonuclease family)
MIRQCWTNLYPVPADVEDSFIPLACHIRGNPNPNPNSKNYPNLKNKHKPKPNKARDGDKVRVRVRDTVNLYHVPADVEDSFIPLACHIRGNPNPNPNSIPKPYPNLKNKHKPKPNKARDGDKVRVRVRDTVNLYHVPADVEDSFIPLACHIRGNPNLNSNPNPYPNIKTKHQRLRRLEIGIRLGIELWSGIGLTYIMHQLL